MKNHKQNRPANLQAVETERRYLAAPLVPHTEIPATNDQIMERSPDI